MTSRQEISFEVLRRDNCQCQSCGKQNAGQIHHLLLKTEDGFDDPSNMITLCGRCHMLAGTTPDWIIAKVWKIQLKNIALERKMVGGSVRRRGEKLTVQGKKS